MLCAVGEIVQSLLPVITEISSSTRMIPHWVTCEYPQPLSAIIQHHASAIIQQSIHCNIAPKQLFNRVIHNSQQSSTLVQCIATTSIQCSNHNNSVHSFQCSCSASKAPRDQSDLSNQKTQLAPVCPSIRQCLLPQLDVLAATD